jgi:transposase InsO family protein
VISARISPGRRSSTRPRGAVHQRGLYRQAGNRWGTDQHGRRERRLDDVFVERLWRSLKYEEVHLRASANGLEARIGIGRWFRFYNERRLHQALGYKTPAVAWAAGVSPVDLPLRLDDAGASPTTQQGQQQQDAIRI